MLTTNVISRIDGKLYYRVFLAGAGKVLENQAMLNRMNIYPVPDGDTGNNLGNTMRAIIDRAQPFESFTKTSEEIAFAALRGARGSSGLILAQFLYGIFRESELHDEIDIQSFSHIVKNAVSFIYDAVPEPLENSILSILNVWTDYIFSHNDQATDFKQLLSDSLSVASAALKKMSQEVSMLKESGMVDAGAKGFLFFLEGALEGIKNNPSALEIIEGNGNPSLPDEVSAKMKKPDRRYALDVLLTARKTEANELRKVLKETGNSVIIAGTGKLRKIHIETNQPEVLVLKLRKFGKLSHQNISDMHRQYESFANRRYKIALLTDSASDLPQELIDKYQIQVIPLNVHFGDNQYLDKLSFDMDTIFRIREIEKCYPVTRQPGEQELINVYSRLTSFYDSVIAVHISGGLSSTFKYSKRAAEIVSQRTRKKISVLDSMQMSGSLGLITLKLASAIDAGMSHEEIVEKFPLWRENTTMFINIKNLYPLMREGKISTRKGVFAKMFNLKPMLTFSARQDRAIYERSLRQKSSMKKVIRHTRRFIKDRQVWNYIIMHADGEKEANWYSDRIYELTGKKSVSVINFSPSIGISTGKGSTAVAVLAEDGDLSKK